MKKRNSGITLLSLIVTIIIMLILAGVAIRAITTDEGVIDEAKSAKTATEMADLREFVDIAILQAETVHTNAKMEDVIQQLIDNGIIEDASQVDIETGTITVGKNTLDGALADYVITPEEKYYGNKNIKATSQTYFTFTVDETTGTATITGVKDECAVKTYYNGEATKYTAVIKDGENYVTDVVIPYEYVDENGKKYTVTEIGDFAFGLKENSTWDAGLSNVENTFKSFVLPNTITTIGKSAFCGTTDLESINIPSSVSGVIGKSAFSECGGVPAILNLPSVTVIDDNCFYGSTTLTSVKLLRNLKTIGLSAFSRCTNLTTIELPAITKGNFGACAFLGCTSLTSIVIPEGVTSIEASTFMGCTSLSSVTLPDSLTRIVNHAFASCKSLESIEIPENVTSIFLNSFGSCTSLKSINIPEKVTTISYNTFSNCTSLENIKIPDGVTSIEANAFTGCKSLKSIEIPNNVTSIGDNAFKGCTGLTSVTIPGNVATLGANGFAECTNLTRINILDGVTSIGRYAFFKCTNVSSVNIPGSVTTMGNCICGYWTAEQTINCEIEEADKPDTWEEKWDYYDSNIERKATLNWGVSM